MRKRWIATISMTVLAWVIGTAPSRAAEPVPLAAEYLYSGRLVEGEAALRKRLLTHPQDDEARLGLFAVQLLSAIERSAQTNYRFGGKGGQFKTLLGNKSIAENPAPEPIRYVDARSMVAGLIEYLAEADATLAKVTDPTVKLRLDLGKVCCDLDGDGKLRINERFWAKSLPVAFDKADVHWFRAQCHFLIALSEFLLAHDWRLFFERAGHVFFAKPVTPHELLIGEEGSRDLNMIDFVALVHLVNWPVVEPQRMKRSLEHLEISVAQWRQCIDSLEAEKDDDNEWAPAPLQRGALRQATRGYPPFAEWRENVDMFEGLLQGKTLLPLVRNSAFPVGRFHDGQGVNLRRVFLEPRRFDLVLWLQGSAARPYLEDGAVEARFISLILESWVFDRRPHFLPFP